MARRLLLLAALAVCAAPLAALRPYNQSARAETAWMIVSSLKTGREYYLEVSRDGQAIMREETSRSLQTRRGGIKPQLVKDFFREIDNSEIINSQNVKQNNLVFYNGELLKISAYINGELTRTEAPLNNFGEAFEHAFGEVKKAAAGLPQEHTLRGFLRAEPVEGSALDAFRKKAAVDGEIKITETSDINRIKPLMAAIKEPHRLIPLETETAAKEVKDFVSSRQLYGLRTLFYIPSTRGTFRCEVIDAQRAQPKK